MDDPTGNTTDYIRKVQITSDTGLRIEDSGSVVVKEILIGGDVLEWSYRGLDRDPYRSETE